RKINFFSRFFLNLKSADPLRGRGTPECTMRNTYLKPRPFPRFAGLPYRESRDCEHLADKEQPVPRVLAHAKRENGLFLFGGNPGPVVLADEKEPALVLLR